MSYNVQNWGSISAHTGPIFVSYVMNGGQNEGAQFAQGNPQSSGAFLVSSNHEIRLNGGKTTYLFQLTNTGSQPTSYTLAGGGLT